MSSYSNTTGSSNAERSAISRRVLIAFSAIPILYALWVLLVVANAGDVGLRCVLGVELKEPVSDEYRWSSRPPLKGDRLTRIGDVAIRHYPDYVDALRAIENAVGRVVEVEWVDAEGGKHAATAEVRSRPFSTYVWAAAWFLQEMGIFLLGAWVYWKRPRDDSARLFFWLCVFTVGAYMGGVHWSEIVVRPILTYAFVVFAVFVPVVSLHFGLVFPRINPFHAQHRRLVLGTIYGLALADVSALFWAIARIRWVGSNPIEVEAAIQGLRVLAFASIGLALLFFVAFFVCLLSTYLRHSVKESERNQVKWILLATLLSFPLIFYLLWRAFVDPSRLGMSSAAWPMYMVSLMFTVAYALSITRYKLMQVDALFDRAKLYLSVSVAAGLLYSAVLVISAMLIGEQLFDQQTGRGGVAAGVTATTLLILSGAIRERFQKAIDRRFYREKYKFDQAMRKMKLAVGSLIDRQTLGRRLLEAAEEVLRVEWAVIYLAGGTRGGFELTASLGPDPDEKEIPFDHPVIVHLKQSPSLRVPHGLGAVSNRAADALIGLGGEVAYALEGNGGEMGGIMVLGPKRSGLPYEDEEIAFLGALSSVATLALHSADIQQTLEELNQELRRKVDKIAEQQRRILLLQDQLMGKAEGAAARAEAPETSPLVFERIKGSSPAVRRMLKDARKVAGSPSTVLIRGESGTGKELLAEAIHAGSARSTRPFVKVHCAALSQTLLESELFGHVRGAFTGADRDRVGRFEQADGGTLFLDEIGDINLEVQTKLLRVLQEMSFERVGSSQTISVDVRILAATHQDLEALIRAGKFREDLYYRLNVFSMTTPSLRDRKEDIFELALFFLQRHAERVGRAVSHIEEDAVEALMAYDWPGNIRELENVIERAVVLADGPALTRADLPAEVTKAPATRRRGRPPRVLVPIAPRSVGGGLDRERTRPAPAEAPSDPDLDAYERVQLLDALEEAGGNKSEAARLFGVPRSTFCSKLKKHGLV